MGHTGRVVTRIALGCFSVIVAVVMVGNILPKAEQTYDKPAVYATVDDVYAALSRQMGGATPDYDTQVKPTLDLHLTYAELQRFVDEGKHADVPSATPANSVTAQPARTTPPGAPTAVVNTTTPVLPIVSITRVDTAPCTTPAKGGLPGWINCQGTVTLQINRTIPSGAVRVGFDWPDTGTFYFGSMQVGPSTGSVKVQVVNTYISHCVTSYGSTVQVYDGATAGPLIARQQVTLTTACQ